MTKWAYEFLVLDFSGEPASENWSPRHTPLEEAGALLNEKGAEGWEAVCLVPQIPGKEKSVSILLKRPSPGKD